MRVRSKARAVAAALAVCFAVALLLTVWLTAFHCPCMHIREQEVCCVVCAAINSVRTLIAWLLLLLACWGGASALLYRPRLVSRVSAVSPITLISLKVRLNP